MWGTFVGLVSQKDFLAAIILVIFGALIFGAWKLAVFCTKTDAATCKLPNIEEKLSKIETGLVSLNYMLIQGKFIATSSYTQQNSPVAMSPNGKKVYKDSGAEELMNNIGEELIKELEKGKIRTALEVQNESLTLLFSKNDDERFSGVQNFAYENPKYDGKDLSYIDILSLMAIALRDKYLEKHPEITTQKR